MKNSKIILGLVAALIAVVVFEEFRIQKLRDELAAKAEVAVPVVKSSTPGPARQISSAESQREATVGERSEPEEKDESAMEGFGKAMRKMADNPAAREMFKTAHMAHAKMIYGPLLKKLELGEEEEEYFLGVISGEMADQQQMGMKMMGLMGEDAEDERQELIEELEAKKEERKKLVEEFLNDEGDNAEFTKYSDRLPEHQQMNGIRAAIAGTGSPLNEQQETQLVDIMHEMRTGSPEAKKWDGPQAMEMFARKDVEEVFETDWAAGQEALKGEVAGVLDEKQSAAFFENQAQMKQMHLMGIKMMQGMMKTGDE